MSMRQQITKSIIINGDAADLYQAWLGFDNHPQFMEHITAVSSDGDETTHWVMDGPLNTKLEWTTKTTRMEPNKRIAWKTIEGDLKSSGQVTFNNLPQGQTEVTVTTQTIPPDNLIDKVATSLFENEGAQLEKDLRNFRNFVETKRTA